MKPFRKRVWVGMTCACVWAAACSGSNATVDGPLQSDDAGADVGTSPPLDATSPTKDASPDVTADARTDAPVARDASRDALSSDGGACSPMPVASPLSPTPAYHPYYRSPVCTNAQITSFVTACVDASATAATCSAWESDVANVACDACVITPATSANWGPIVAIAQRDIPFNIAGCFGIVANEGASVTGCGAARWAYDRCVRTACPIASCAVDPANPTPAEEASFTACRSAAAGSVCAAATQQVDSKCAALGLESATPLTDQACPLGPNVSIAQFTQAIVRTFCGGVIVEAGGGG